ncbi:MAG: hypothetical protein DLM50_02390 [Candidatus Meridianibacter frigidus]|nr:MAG: hypothetical protein DLM50_02390 [Candidatus Eremiobacteraeota bacterium]
MNLKALLVAAALGTTAIAGVAGAQTVTLPNGTTVNAPVAQTANPNYRLRGERGSSRNIAGVRHRLERLIDELQRDRRDYGGHREQAIDLMGQARNQLLQAEEYDRSHPNQ